MLSEAKADLVADAVVHQARRWGHCNESPSSSSYFTPSFSGSASDWSMVIRVRVGIPLSLTETIFGTSMSAHHILGLEQVPRVRLFAD